MRICSIPSIALALTIMTQAASADEKRTRELLRTADGQIDVITEGAGPLVILLPSRGRDSEDYDEVARGIAEAGFRVLRPQPRGMRPVRSRRCATSRCTTSRAISPR